MSKSVRLKSFMIPKPSSFLLPLCKLLSVLSDVVEAVAEEVDDPTIKGPLVFLKIEGDRHFLPA